MRLSQYLDMFALENLLRINSSDMINSCYVENSKNQSLCFDFGLVSYLNPMFSQNSTDYVYWNRSSYHQDKFHQLEMISESRMDSN